MCRVLYRSLEFTVELSLSFCFVPEAMKNRLMRLPSGFCWNHCTLLTMSEKLHHRVELAPSWRLKTEGLCSTFTPLTPAWKEEEATWMISLESHGWGFQTRTLSQETPEDVGPSRSSRSALLPSLPLTAVDTPQFPVWDDPNSQQIWTQRNPSRAPHFLFMIPCPVTEVPSPLLWRI